MNIERVIEADVVVLGGGLAGHSAAVEVAKAGRQVVVLEKMDQVGGSTVLSGGSIAFAGTPHQQKQGINDSEELFRRDLEACAGPGRSRDLIDVYLRHQKEAYELLLEFGVVFNEVQFSSNQSVPRSHPTPPARLIELMGQLLHKLDGEVHTNTAARKLLRSTDSDRRIVGVLAEQGGKQLEYRAKLGVIIATGGFSQGPAIMKMLAPHLVENVLFTGGAGNQGDGLRMAWDHGAAIADIDALVPTFGALKEEALSEPNTILLAYYRGGIVVNSDAQRFIDESKSYKSVGKASLDQKGAYGVQIFDEKVMNLSVRSPKTLDFKLAYDKGRVIKADTIADLARKAGLDAEALENTVEEYNEGIASNNDKFGRKHLAHTVGEAFPLVTAPYYAYVSVPYMASTYAGIHINSQMQVMDIWDRPIDGLYAAGEVVGGAHGKGYMTGTALGKAFIFGRCAAKAAMGL